MEIFIELENSKTLPISECYRTEPPFSIVTKNKKFKIEVGERPIYFKRNQLKSSGGETIKEWVKTVIGKQHKNLFREFCILNEVGDIILESLDGIEESINKIYEKTYNEEVK